MISFQRLLGAVLGLVRVPCLAQRASALDRYKPQVAPSEKILLHSIGPVACQIAQRNCLTRAGALSLFSRLIVLCLWMIGCAAHLRDESSPQATDQAGVLAPKQSDISLSTPFALSWDNAERLPWSQELISAVRLRKVTLDRGHPETFAPGYSHLSSDGQVKFWAELVISISKFESDWDPHARYHEAPPLTDSIGLLQLSYLDASTYRLDQLDESARALEDPPTNLRCAVSILAQLVETDGVLTAGTGEHSRGAARYWSVMREGPGHHLPEIRSRTIRNVGLL